VTLPLEGLKVLDLSRLLPGDFCSMLLSDFGADVVKVEDTGLGDYLRWSPPYYEGPEESARGAMFLALNRGKRSIRIDLKNEHGKEVLLTLARDADVLLESFRPGVLDRLGVGYERLKEINPGLVYCAITGYGQDGPNRDRSGHDMNYLGLNGLLALTGEADGPPVQAAGQIADVGGGSLMAALGVMVALRERERSGVGQFVDCSMFDGALSWLAMVVAEAFASGRPARRGDVQLAGSLTCYRPYKCADGYVTLGALEPKFWRAWCEGVGRPDLVDHAFDPPGSDTHRAVSEVFASRTREQWRQFASQHDCCLEPVLELEEALESQLVAAREMVVELAQPGAPRPVKQLGVPIKLSRTPADPTRAPGPGLGEHTDRDGLQRRGDRRAARGGRGSRPGRRSARVVHARVDMGAPAGDMLKMSELAQRSGVSAGTIKHYLREGLLGSDGGVLRTSRNMAYYPPEFVDRIQLIKRLQEERFMPLRVIRDLLTEDPSRAARMIELEDRILERAIAERETGRTSRAKVRQTYDVPRNVLDRLEELEVLTPSPRGYDADDVAIIAAISRFRAGGYEQALGFTVYDTLRYRKALQPLVEEEVGVLLANLAGKVDVDRAVEIIESGSEPLRELIGAMHAKLLLAALRRYRGVSE
jgi:alpha-methylacyl-CoA racemase